MKHSLNFLGIISFTAFCLVACNPPVDETPGAFETIPETTIADPDCLFRVGNSAFEETQPDEVQADAGIAEEDVTIDPNGIVFATYRDNPDFLAVARFKGETIKLAPKEIPEFEGDTFDVTYDVIEYRKWQIRAVSQQGEGELRLIRNNVVTDVSIAMQGSCG